MGVTLITVTDIVTRGGDGGDTNYGHRYCHKSRGARRVGIYSHRYCHKRGQRREMLFIVIGVVRRAKIILFTELLVGFYCHRYCQKRGDISIHRITCKFLLSQIFHYTYV